MTRHETNKRNMYGSVTAVADSNVTLISELPVFATAVTGLKEIVTQIDAVDSKYLTAAGGKTQTKKNAEDELLADLMPVKSGLYALGITSNNEELKALCGESEWTLKKMRDPDFLAKAKIIKAEAAARIMELAPYKITEAMLTELQEKIEAFEEALSGKDTSFTSRSALRKELSEKFDAADEIIEHQLDTMIELVKKSQPLFYDQYFAARNIKDLGASHKTEEVKTPEPAK